MENYHKTFALGFVVGHYPPSPTMRCPHGGPPSPGDPYFGELLETSILRLANPRQEDSWNYQFLFRILFFEAPILKKNPWRPNSQYIFKDMFFLGKSWLQWSSWQTLLNQKVKLVLEVERKMRCGNLSELHLTNETMVFSGRNLRSDCCDSIYKMKSNDSTKKLNHLRPKKLVLKCREGERVYSPNYMETIKKGILRIPNQSGFHGVSLVSLEHSPPVISMAISQPLILKDSHFKDNSFLWKKNIGASIKGDVI